MIPADVSQSVTAVVRDEQGQVTDDAALVRFEFRLSDPLAVTMVTAADGVEVEWVFARDLLRQGMVARAGDADVIVWPALRGGCWTVTILLSSPDGVASLEFPMELVQSFLDRSKRLAPYGGEVVDMDSVISRILSAA